MSAQQDESSSSSSNHPRKSSFSGFRSPTPTGTRSSCNRQTPSLTRAATAVSEMTMSTWSKNGILPCCTHSRHSHHHRYHLYRTINQAIKKMTKTTVYQIDPCQTLVPVLVQTFAIDQDAPSTSFLLRSRTFSGQGYRNKDDDIHWTRRTKQS